MQIVYVDVITITMHTIRYFDYINIYLLAIYVFHYSALSLYLLTISVTIHTIRSKMTNTQFKMQFTKKKKKHTIQNRVDKYFEILSFSEELYDQEYFSKP